MRAIFAISIGLCLAGSATAAPLELYGRLPAIETVAVSPDGARLALAVTNGEQRRIVIENAADKTPLAVINAGLQKVRDLRWAGADHVLITTSSTGYVEGAESDRSEQFVVTVFDVVKKAQRQLLAGLDLNDQQKTGGTTTLNIALSYPEVRTVAGKPVVFIEGVSFVANRGRRTLFKVDIGSSRQELVSQGVENTSGYVVNGKGELVAEEDYDAVKAVWTLRIWRGHWDEGFHQPGAIERPRLFGMGRDDSSVTVGMSDKGDYELREASLAGGPLGPVMASHVDRVLFDGATGHIIGTKSEVNDKASYVFFDPADDKIWRALDKAYAPARSVIESYSDDRRAWVLSVDSPTEGPAFAVVDLASRKGRFIGDQYLGLKPADIGEVRPVSFSAGDGLAVTGYVTLPPGKTPRRLPLVVLPHERPAARDRPLFYWWAQALASRGYAVLQVNYRGAAGLGWAFESAGFGQWGRKMQTDLSDGVRAMAAQGLIDPARVCIVGEGYGGYAALAGATLDPGVYRCAVSVSGFSDLKRFVDWSSTREGRQGAANLRYWARYMGPPSSLVEISPALHAGAATIPILLIHGKDDTVVPYAQSEEMAAALRAAGKPVEMVTLKGEDHWLSEGATRLQMLQATVAFLEKNNPAN